MHKGLDTHRRAILAGDEYGGCSVHVVTADLDGDGVPEIVLGMGGEVLGGKDPGIAIHSGKDAKLLFSIPRGRSVKFGVDAFGGEIGLSAKDSKPRRMPMTLRPCVTARVSATTCRC